MANKITGVALKLRRVPADVVDEAVARFDVIAKESASRVVGGGATMRMHTRRGRVAVKLGTRSKVLGSGEHVTAIIDGTPSFAWVWINTGTQPHNVGRRGDFLHGPRYDHPIRAPLAHPGARGQGAWNRAVDTFRSEYRDLAAEVVAEAMK